MALCSTCKIESTGDFCSTCGNSLVIHRIDKSYVAQELLKLIGYDKGFLYTAKGLLLRPGKIIQEYIHEDRQKITKPIAYLLLTSVIYTFISHYFKADMIQNDMLKAVYGDSPTYKIFYWVQNNYGYGNLLLLIPLALWTKFLFSDHKYNIYETFVMMSLVLAEGMLLYTFHVLLNSVFPQLALLNEFIMGAVMLVYLTWSIGQFYGGKRANYWMALLSYILGMITFQVVVIVVGIFLALI